MITNLSVRFELLSSQILRCLRHLTDNVVGISLRLPSPMFRRGDDDNRGAPWKSLGRPVFQRMGDILWVAAIYLASELLIWGLSLALRPMRLQFLASILGMALVFVVMVSFQQLYPGSEGFYRRNIKSKIDFINSNLGLGFPVPLVTISQEQLLSGTEIARVVGNFVNTNIIFWTLVFLLSWGILAGLLRLPPFSVRRFRKSSGTEQAWQPDIRPHSLPHIELPPQTPSRRPSESTTLNGAATTGYHTDKEAGLGPDSRTVSVYFTDSDCPTPIPPPAEAGGQSGQASLSQRANDSGEEGANWVSWVPGCYPLVMAVFFLVVVGIPVSRTTGDDRILDGCMLWFTWIGSTRLQRNFGQSQILANLPAVKTTTTTLLNPVLLTTLGMTAYTRAKAAAMQTPVRPVLAMFSSGTSLSDLWTSKTTSWTLRGGQRDWFGAGDAALSILECGIVVWGFKLYECRQQIWSRAGAAVVLISVAIAALNVFVSVLLGSAVGLDGPEALAFAARSTTLALARPAIEALAGNQVVNAALVVSNGILGQLMYPFLLGRLRIEGREENEEEEAVKDDALTIGAGAAIGINGAAMGVAYLYERKSRAAPYAALSMTVVGVMTVVFTAVEPFTGTLTRLAPR